MDRPLPSHGRTHSIGAADAKEPHALSLKVLRLTRPSLSPQHPLPTPSPSSLSSSIPTAAFHAYPSAPDDPFTLSPLLTLPPAFGNAYVGETFACTLCANNELRDEDLKVKERPRIHNVRIEAEMKTPSQTVPVPVSFAPSKAAPSSTQREDEEDEKVSDDPLGAQAADEAPPLPPKVVDEDHELTPGSSLQALTSFHLREQGAHILSVTITYSTSTSLSGRVRTFRKLYQFVASPALVVRTKIGSLNAKATGKEGWILEAQVENVGDESVVLEGVEFNTADWCAGESVRSLLQKQLGGKGNFGKQKKVLLARGGVQQVAFVVRRVEGKEQGGSGMGTLSIRWRGPMGNVGELSTGWLGVRGR